MWIGRAIACFCQCLTARAIVWLVSLVLQDCLARLKDEMLLYLSEYLVFAVHGAFEPSHQCGSDPPLVRTYTAGSCAKFSFWGQNATWK